MTETTITGIPDFVEALTSLPHKLRRRALLNALKAGARLVQAAERSAVPIMSLRASLKAPYRTPGLLRQKISVRSSRLARQAGDVGVFVNIPPAKGGMRGARSPGDPFYWRFVAFGTRKMAARNFLEPGAAALPAALGVITAKLATEFAKLNVNPKDPL